MTLIEKLYQTNESSLNSIWERFIFFDPEIPYLGYKNTSKAIRQNDKRFFITQIRNCLIPEQDDEIVQETFREKMNCGIKELNLLCDTYLQEIPFDFKIEEIPSPLNFFDFIQSARQDWISARNGKHLPDKESLFKVYQKIRSFGLGYLISIIDESPEVINSINQYNLILNWFNEYLNFSNPQETGIQEFSHTWQTKPGISIFGSKEKPMRSRLKILNTQTDELNYGSILMKMFLKEIFPEDIRDLTGVEFIVENERDRGNLTCFFRNEIGAYGRLEAFKEQSRNKNRFSSPDYGFVKFILRPPISIEAPIHPSNKPIYQRTPVEIQILTLDDDKERKDNPDVTHEEYKRKQFLAVFPAWFPQKIYSQYLENL